MPENIAERSLRQRYQKGGKMWAIGLGKRARENLPAMVVIVILFALWQFGLTLLKVPSYVVPRPVNIFGDLFHDWRMVTYNLQATSLEAVSGFLLGTAVAILFASGFLFSNLLERAFFPIAIAVSTVPLVAVAPVLILLLGQGFTSKMVMTAMISFFPTLVNVARGLQAVDTEVLEFMHMLSASRWQVFRKVRVYTSIPYLFSALRITSTASVIGAIVAEWVGAQRGLGYLIIQETFNYNTTLLWGVMIVSAALATTFFLVIVGLDRITRHHVIR